LGFLLFAGGWAFGQETRATLGGKVTASNGAVIQHATVVMTADETGVVQAAETNNSGDWRIQSLLPGHYHFEVSAPGFKTIEHSSIELQIADQKTVDVQLQVGAQTETVTVEASTPLIDTTAAISGAVLNTKELEEVPSNSNSPTLLAGLVPGVTIGAPTGAAVAHLWGNASDSAVMVNAAGSGTQSVNYSLNGGTDTNNQGQVAYVPPMDAVSEVRVVTNAYDASIGRQSSAAIQMISKTGTKSYHGSLYEMNQNNFLNANSAQNDHQNALAAQGSGTYVPIPPVHMNEYGGVVGGPVRIPKLFDGRKEKTFFFFNWDGIRNTAPASTGNMSIPTMAERTGDFSKSFTTTTTSGVKTTYATQLFDPATINSTTMNRTAFAGEVIPSNRISATAQAYLALLPAPDNAGDGANTDSNNYIKREVQADKFDEYALRFDQSWNNNHHSYVDLRRNYWTELSYDPFGPSNVLQGLWQKRVNEGLTVAHTVVLSRNIVADFRYNVTAWQGNSYSSSAGVSPTTLGFPASSIYVGMMQTASLPLVTGIVSGAENGGLGTNQAGTYTNDTDQDINLGVTHMWKNHSFRYGAEDMIIQEGTGSLGQQGGSFSFDTKWTDQNPNTTACTGCGNDTASMLLGLPDGGSIPTAASAFWSQHYYGVYFQDAWRATSKLTLNMGLRWDYESPLTERFNRFWSRYNETLLQSATTAVAQTGYASLLAGSGASNTGVALLQQLRPSASTFNVEGGILYAGLNGTSRDALNPRYKYFQPRLGFAYQLRNNMVIRGGLGRFVQATFTSAGSQEGYTASTPFQPTTNNYLTAAATFDNPYPNGATVKVTGNSLGTLTNVGSHTSYTDPNIGRPYADEASLYLQQQVKDYLFEIGGTLNLTHGLGMGFQHNIPTGAVYTQTFTPTFDATGRPVDTLAGNMQVPNPFKGAPYITNGTQNNSTIGAYQLLRPQDPLTGLLTLTQGKGRTNYYAMNTKIERRFKDGFSLLQAFSWSKRIEENTFLGQQVYGVRIDKSLDTADQRFNYNLTPVYELPFGHGKRFASHAGKLENEALGGWEITGVYHFQSGTPLNLATNSAFWDGTDPSLGNKKSGKEWFDTSKFEPFPSRSMTTAQIALYPSWTKVQGLPGAGYTPAAGSTDATKNGVYQDFTTWSSYNQHTFGNIRNPYTTTVTLGVRKSFPIADQTRLQLRIDAFNALNHPQFGNIDTTPGDAYFGWVNGTTTPNQVNQPRSIQMEGKFYF
jgi:hypothetical protein